VLWRYTWTTLVLCLLVGFGTLVLGTGTAWLVTMTDFPGRRVLEVALVIPLAFPAYVLAYAYTHLLDHPGVVRIHAAELDAPTPYLVQDLLPGGSLAERLAETSP